MSWSKRRWTRLANADVTTPAPTLGHMLRSDIAPASRRSDRSFNVRSHVSPTTMPRLSLPSTSITCR